MKRVIVFLVGAGFVFTGLTVANAGFWGKKKTEPKPAAEESSTAAKPAEAVKPAPAAQTDKIDKAREETLKAKRALAQKKLNELNNTEWTIDLVSMSAKSKKEVDVITIKNSQVTIASFNKKGFPTTNFTLTVQEDGTVIWETMQTSEKSGIAFWRGELDSKLQNMRGVVSHQLDNKSKQDYSFVSTAKKNILSSGK